MRICPDCENLTTEFFCPEDGTPTVEAPEDARDWRTDTRLGSVFEERYSIQSLIGRGGMGAVYKAIQLAVSRPVAIKIMRPDLSDSPTEIARFQQEARAVASLHHPNVISLIDFGQAEDGSLYLVMEYLEGEALDALLEREGKLSPQRTAAIAGQMLEALGVAHEQRIVHRDLKPENVFLTTVGRKKEVVKLLDFGIAKVRGGAGAEMTLTQAGVAIGSPPYMAPEQCMASAVTPRTDIYSFGCIVYEMLAGRTVFECDSMTDYLFAHVEKEPPLPKADGHDLVGPLVDLVMQCLAKDPEDRPPDAYEAARLLEDAMMRGGAMVLGKEVGADAAPNDETFMVLPALSPDLLKQTLNKAEKRAAPAPAPQAAPAPAPEPKPEPKPKPAPAPQAAPARAPKPKPEPKPKPAPAPQPEPEPEPDQTVDHGAATVDLTQALKEAGGLDALTGGDAAARAKAAVDLLERGGTSDPEADTVRLDDDGPKVDHGAATMDLSQAVERARAAAQSAKDAPGAANDATFMMLESIPESAFADDAPVSEDDPTAIAIEPVRQPDPARRTTPATAAVQQRPDSPAVTHDSATVMAVEALPGELQKPRPTEPVTPAPRTGASSIALPVAIAALAIIGAIILGLLFF